jgi:hypothetical protein
LRPKSAGNERENEGRKGGMIKINEKWKDEEKE